MQSVTVEEMKRLEKRAVEAGISYLALMENAAQAVTDQLSKDIPLGEKSVLILCGSGNNGGDGYAAARLLYRLGAKPILFPIVGPPKTEEAIQNADRAASLSIPVWSMDADWKEAIRTSDIILDSVYGTGFHGSLPDIAKEVFDEVNRAEATVYAIDLPSGMNADTGEYDPSTIRADVTVALDSLKQAHLMEETKPMLGKVIRADIGIPDTCHL